MQYVGYRPVEIHISIARFSLPYHSLFVSYNRIHNLPGAGVLMYLEGGVGNVPRSANEHKSTQAHSFNRHFPYAYTGVSRSYIYNSA